MLAPKDPLLGSTKMLLLLLRARALVLAMELVALEMTRRLALLPSRDASPLENLVDAELDFVPMPMLVQPRQKYHGQVLNLTPRWHRSIRHR